jgi:hypothetical protein
MEVSGLVSFKTQPFYPQEKSPWYPLDRGLGGLQSWSGHGDEEKNSQPLLGLEPLIIQPIAQHYTTELSQFLCSSVWIKKNAHDILEVHFISNFKYLVCKTC